MADASLKVVITAVDKASKSMSKVAGAADKMGKAGLIAAGGIAAFGATSVKAYAEAEAAQAKLQDTFDRFPRLADISIDSLRDYNSELQNKTRFDDDAIASGQAILGQYDLTGQQLKDLTPLIADFAAKTGQSFEAASEAVGKGLLGSGRAFKQIGIDFQDTGTQAGNLQQIMGGLRSQVGGFAEQEAKTGAGAAERLKNQFGELQETVGAQLLPPLTTLAGVASDVLIRFNELPGPVKNVTGATVLLGVAALIAAPRVVALQTALSNAGGARGGVDRFRGGLSRAAGFLTGPWGIALAGAVTVVGVLAAKHMDGKRKIEAYTDAIKADSGALGENTRAAVVNSLEKEGLLRKAQLLGISAEDLTDAVLGEKGALERVNDELGRYDTRLGVAAKAGVGAGGQAKKNAAAARDLRDAVAGGNSELAEAAAANKRTGEAMGDTGKKAEGAAEGIGELNEELDDGKTSIDRFKEALDGLAGGFLDLDAARDRAKGAQDDFAESLKNNGKTLDSNTEKGRANKEALRRIAESAKDSAESVFKLIEPTKGVQLAQGRANQELSKGREAFIKAAIAAGRTRTQAEKLATQYGLLPKGVTTKITANTGTAKKKVDEFVRYANGRTIVIDAKVRTEGQEFQGRRPGNGVNQSGAPSARTAGGGRRVEMAVGGKVNADGLAMLHKGEVVMPYERAMGIEGGGRPTVVVNVYGSALASKQEIARVVTDALKSSGARGLATA